MKKIIIDPSTEERDLEDYYYVYMSCSNCGEPNGIYQGTVDVIISKGSTTPGYPLKCPNCGCNTLK